jgi:PiT family inorganic phosphate transporter
MTIAILTVCVVALLAFANGANDVSKGVATLAGTGRATYRTAIAWGTAWTLAGCLASIPIAAGMVRAFTSAVVAADVLGTAAFPIAVSAGSAAWVLLASATGLPVSTTHAITGAIVGYALTVGGPSSVHWPVLLLGVAAPLVLSPLASAAIAYGAYAVTARFSSACLCFDAATMPMTVARSGTLEATSVPSLVAAAAGCESSQGRSRFIAGATLHWGAGAALSFARGLNDNAKIAAMGVVGFSAVTSDLSQALIVTAAAMGIGGYVAGMRVSRTLGERVVHMEADTGLTAALVAASLVLAASIYTLPVSTTHVSTGAIVGAGLRQGARAVQWRPVLGLAAAWLVTLPTAAAFASLAAWLSRSVL